MSRVIFKGIWIWTLWKPNDILLTKVTFVFPYSNFVSTLFCLYLLPDINLNRSNVELNLTTLNLIPPLDGSAF